MKKLIFSYLLRIVCLFAAAVGVAYFIFTEQYVYAGMAGFAALILVYRLFSKQFFLIRQLEEFAEAVKYRDFTRRYPVRRIHQVEGKLFAAFNEINKVYRDISVDKEAQHEYLNRVVNMLDSAIIFYHVDSGKVLWLNDAFKQLFQLPHLGKISGLEKRNPELFQKTMNLKMGQQQIETVHSSRGKIKLLMQLSEYETKEGHFRLGVYQNINEAIDETETRAWHKLLRVLTHEIMNSIGPISSLAETLHGRLERWEGSEEVDDLKEGVFTIKRRSEGLLQFATSYRLINKVDQPQFADIQVVQLFESVYQLLEPTLLQKNINLDIIIKNTRLILRADVSLVEQVLINLLLNAFEAVKDVSEPYISLQALENEGKLLIKIKDNGVGMSPEVQEQIFTPFFTTKKSGTGVGLTLSKQIMLLHKGNLFVESEKHKGSTFVLQFVN